jgi:hypothetical protein
MCRPSRSPDRRGNGSHCGHGPTSYPKLSQNCRKPSPPYHYFTPHDGDTENASKGRTDTQRLLNYIDSVHYKGILGVMLIRITMISKVVHAPPKKLGADFDS